MNIYTVEFFHGQSKTAVSVKAKNKMVAVTEAYGKLKGWREKDRVEIINIIEDANNETSAESYK